MRTGALLARARCPCQAPFSLRHGATCTARLASYTGCHHAWTDPYSRRRGRSGGTQCDQDGPRGRGLRGRRERGWADALAKLRARPQPSLILLDLMMPGMNGWQFMDEVRVHPGPRQVPIVVVSAYGSADGVRSVGANYLKKPFDLVSRHA